MGKSPVWHRLIHDYVREIVTCHPIRIWTWQLGKASVLFAQEQGRIRVLLSSRVTLCVCLLLCNETNENKRILRALEHAWFVMRTRSRFSGKAEYRPSSTVLNLMIYLGSLMGGSITLTGWVQHRRADHRRLYLILSIRGVLTPCLTPSESLRKIASERLCLGLYYAIHLRDSGMRIWDVGIWW